MNCELRSRHRSLATYATLVRLPNLFTAPPDVVLGAALVAGVGHAVSIGAIVGLAAASMLLYAAGTTLNDYFDSVEDARDRPERPIPAGDISRRQAFVFGVFLLIGGVGLALFTAGTGAGVVASALALVIVLYDGVFKGSAIGFLFMGASRGLNILLGTMAAVSQSIVPRQALAAAMVVLIYITAVTYMAESETGGGNRSVVLPSIAGLAIAALGVVGLIIVRSPPPFEIALTAVLLIGFVGWVGRPLLKAYSDPTPKTIGPAIGTCIIGLTILNAAFASTVGTAWAVAVLVFFVPAIGLSRLYNVT